MNKSKSLKLNMLLNAVKGIMGIIFPLITFPYASRTLGVENIGVYSFTASIISYFNLIAGLGITTYAIREGARVRDDRKAFDKFISQIYTINLLSTLVAYSLLIPMIFFLPRFNDYKAILLILSLQIIFKTIGVEWLYSVYEEYAYITIRSVLFQIISLLLLFVLVRNANDVNSYAAITVVSAVGSNILNFFHSRKYCKISITRNLEIKKHYKPIIILFGMTLTTTIYVSSGSTILGFFCGNYNVGLYSAATKVYSIVKTILSSVLVVSIPRLAAYLGKNEYEKFKSTAGDIYKTLLSLVIPAVVGMILLRKEIILFLADETFLEATNALALLSISLIFCLGAWFWGQCILIALKKDKKVFIATVASAIVNVIVNISLVMFLKHDAAALATMLAEATAFIICSIEGKKYVKFDGVGQTVIKIVVGCIGIGVTVLGIQSVTEHGLIRLVASVILSVIVYFTIEILLKNDACGSFINDMKKRIKK